MEPVICYNPARNRQETKSAYPHKQKNWNAGSKPDYLHNSSHTHIQIMPTMPSMHASVCSFIFTIWS